MLRFDLIRLAWLGTFPRGEGFVGAVFFGGFCLGGGLRGGGVEEVVGGGTADVGGLDLAYLSAEAWLVETVIFWMGASSAWAVNT